MEDGGASKPLYSSGYRERFLNVIHESVISSDVV